MNPHEYIHHLIPDRFDKNHSPMVIRDVITGLQREIPINKCGIKNCFCDGTCRGLSKVQLKGIKN